jgi:acetylornithine deacetylase/succinyl-diaminopimelate desuccinylase-like protein
MNVARPGLFRFAVLGAAFLLMPILSTTKAARSAPQLKLTRTPAVLSALKILDGASAATTAEQIRITEIPAPTFSEAARGAYLSKLFSESGLKVTTDDVGNVIAERPGRSSDIVMVVAHLDTVFQDTSIRVRRDGDRIFAPGITDNGAGLVALVALVRAMRDAKIATAETILFVADVGEEGEGNLRGMRKLVDTYEGHLKYVIALDGAATDYVVTSALASRRVEVTISGPGGHSWSDFGSPNPIHAASRAIAQFVNTPLPESPRSSFNVGEIQGGTSVNSIPASAAFKVDLRSETDAEIAKLEAALRKSVQSGISDEMAAARSRNNAGKPLDVEFKVLGVRPGGQLAADSPLRAAVQAADDFLGNRSRNELSSTDANIPLSSGIPAIAIGAGGLSAGAHSTAEWYNPLGRELGLKRALLTILDVAGVLSDDPPR